MKVSTQLALGMGAIATLGIAIAIFASVSMRSIADDTKAATGERMAKVKAFSTLKDNANSIGRYARSIVINGDPAFQAGEKRKIAVLRADNARLLSELDPMLRLPESRQLLKTVVDTGGPYNQLLDRLIEFGEQGKQAEASALLQREVILKQDLLFRAIDDSNALQRQLSQRQADHATQSADRGMALLIGLSVVTALIGGLVGWLLNRSLRRALGAEPAELSEVVQRIAAGDLATPVPLAAGDTTSTMAAVQRMQAALTGIVGTVRGNAESVATASSQIAQGNTDLSQRTEQQASALQQTAATMDQLGSTVRNTADSARQANQLAMNASGVAVKGGEVVGQVVETMKGINDRSKKVADIIAVIDGIAFQTNILALNAAVEAARAGEQGRGFAVVASEVRNLAQRSAEAAKEIKSLISGSVDQVERGTVLVDQAGQTMQEIVAAIRRVSDIVGEISAASNEQSAGVGQVGQAVTQMDQVTQQNAALVEQSAAAADSLKQQAQQLLHTVAVFKLGGQPAQTAAGMPSVERRAQRPAAGVVTRLPVKAKPAAIRSVPASEKPSAAGPGSQPPTARTGTDDWEAF